MFTLKPIKEGSKANSNSGIKRSLKKAINDKNMNMVAYNTRKIWFSFVKLTYIAAIMKTGLSIKYSILRVSDNVRINLLKINCLQTKVTNTTEILTFKFQK